MMPVDASGRCLYPTLEGATVADATADPSRRLMFEYDTRAGAFTGRQWVYRVDPSTPFVSDIAPLDANRLVVMERDGVNPGVQRRVYVVGLRDVGPDGSLVKRQVVDLGAVPDPDLISLPEIHPGDIGLGNPFRVVCVGRGDPGAAEGSGAGRLRQQLPEQGPQPEPGRRQRVHRRRRAQAVRPVGRGGETPQSQIERRTARVRSLQAVECRWRKTNARPVAVA